MQKLHDLNDMAAFAKVVQAGGFTAAANTLGLPKSNVSRRISRLENELGVRLLERTTRRLHLTEMGKVYFQHCQRMLEEASCADLSLTQHNESPSGLLRISCPVTIGQQLITPLMAEFLEKHNDIQLQLTLTSRQVDLIEESVDISIHTNKPSSPQLTCHNINPVDMMFFASHDYLKHKGEPKQPEALTQHDLLVVAEGDTPDKLKLISKNQKKIITITPRTTVNDLQTIQQLAIEGAGVALLPTLPWLINSAVIQRHLKQILPEWSVAGCNYYLYYPSLRSNTPRIRAFVEFMANKTTGYFSNL